MKTSSIKTLIIEDSRSDALLLQRHMRDCRLHTAEVCWVETLVDALNKLNSEAFDLVITDLGLPDSSGIDTVASLHAAQPHIPILALTNESAIESDLFCLDVMRAGASDYIPKSEITGSSIARAIVYTLERFQMGNKLQANNKLLNEANLRLEAKNKRLAKLYKTSQQFVDNVSHEFRTPLTVIREFAAIVRDGIDGPVTDLQKSRLSSLINRTDDLANMVDDLLDSSRLESGLLRANRREHSLETIVSQVARTLHSRAKSKNIHINVIPSKPDLKVHCDEEKLRRVLINLVVNAIKFSPDDSEIRITAEAADSHRASITVADNGPGIPADELHRIFERFQQVKCHHRMASCKGFGLGLSIARSLAYLNLGQLNVSSEEGCGSQFSVSVPLSSPLSVMSCFLEQHVNARPKELGISQLEVVASHAESDTLELVDDFIRGNVTTFDLTLQPSDNRWQLFIRGGAQQTKNVIDRFKTDWQRQQSTHFGKPLPNLEFNHIASFDLPSEQSKVIQAAADLCDQSPKPTTPVSQKKQVLVIDDEKDLTSAIQLRLHASGFEATTANDGPSGLLKLEQTSPDVVLLDVRMPGMDGLQVLDQLKANSKTQNTPVIVLSACSKNKDAALEKGADYFIQKPFQSKEIIAAIGTCISN